MNRLIIVGHLTTELTKFDENLSVFSLSVSRPYKNDKEEHSVDNIKCLVTSAMKDNLTEYINLGDIISIKGHIEVINDTNYVIAEKITFLATKGE